MNWAALVAAALAMWGWWPSREIVVLDEPVRDNEYKLARTSHDDDNCYIHVYSSTWAPGYDPFKIIAHEVGHCIGLPHIEQEGIMNATYEGYEFSVWDRAEFLRHYPASRIVVTGVAHD